MYLQSLSSVVGLRQASASTLLAARLSAANRIAPTASPDSRLAPPPGPPSVAGSTPALADELEFSVEAQAILEAAPPLAGSQATATEQPAGEATNRTSAQPADDASIDASQASDESTDDVSETADDAELTPEEQEQVQKLAERDREVRTHEQAHLAAAGPHARGGPTYTYQKGPDGKRYAIGGEVQIDTAPVAGDPEATIRKAQIVRAAALAPAEPSSQDRAVAAAATKMQQEAQAELLRMRSEANSETSV